MQSPNKRLRPSTPADFAAQDDFVPLGDDDNAEDSKPGHGEVTSSHSPPPRHAPRGPRPQYLRDPGFHRRNARDRPKSRHALPDHEPWVLVKTKLGRRFVHNTQSCVSLWRVPDDVWPAVRAFDEWERQQKEKEANAKWAEEELHKMQAASKADAVNEAADAEESQQRRRRSESLQREDEEAIMAELAAQAEHAEEQDAKHAVKMYEPVAGDVGYDSEGSYEYVEVTDSEREEGGEDEEVSEPQDADDKAVQPDQTEDEPVEFGEDDIAYQLAAMGNDYGLDPGEYDAGDDYEYEEGAEGLPISDEDAANLFRDLLDDYQISPFTPWEKLIADESDASILNDDRYTVLPSMKARREVWDQWAKDKAAQIKEERAKMEKRDPKIPYLAFLAEKATPKLYWPEFKRKFKREPEMNERKMSDRDRERLYRDHISRLKLAESSRKADLITLLKSVPLRDLNRNTPLDSLPQQLLGHLHFISLSASVRDKIVSQHISSLPAAPEGDEANLSAEQLAAEEKKRVEKRKREAALAERQRKVDEERRKADKEERFARRGLLEEERELRRAMTAGNRGLMAQLAAGESDVGR